MARISFPLEVADKLVFYVYRLIDPRNARTFYVGKGRGDRVFQHANGAIRPSVEEEILDAKLRWIGNIRAAGFELGRIILDGFAGIS